jgi:two-component system cell cycle response regulator DivK
MAYMAKILVVEDNPSCFRLVRDLLHHQGHSIYHSSHGLDVFELIQTHHPDLIFMDIQLPQVSGTELIRSIRAEHDISLVPIVAMTACAMRGDEERIRRSGCDEYLSKPLEIVKLVNVVNRLLSDRQPSMAPSRGR